MLKANTGWSKNEDAFEAGRECALMAAEGLDAIKMAFTYVSSDHDVEAFLRGIQKEMPAVPVIGNTSFKAVVLPGGLVGGDRFAGMMALSADDGLNVTTAAAKNDGDAVMAGRNAASLAHTRARRVQMPDYCYLAANPGCEEDYIKGIRDVLGPIPIFGGSAVDNLVMGDWCSFTEEGRIVDGLALALFYSAKPMANHFTGAAYRETGDTAVVTKTDGPRRLLELDDRPALEHITTLNGFDEDLVRGADMMVATIMNPLAVKRDSGHLAVRHPMYLYGDESVAMGADLEVGDRTIRLETTVDEMVSAVGEALKTLRRKMNGTRPGAYHLALNFARMGVMADRMDEVVAQLHEAAEGVPFIMQFTLSEFGETPEAGDCPVGNLMMSFTALPQ